MIRTAAAGDGLAHVDVTRAGRPPPEDLPDARSLITPEHGKRHAFWNTFDVRVIARNVRAAASPSSPQWVEWFRVHCEAGFADAFVDAGA